MEGCEMNLIKYILFIVNLIFAISGIGLIVAGALVLSNIDDFKHFLENELLAPPIILIVVAVIVFLTAFLGCFGAIRESYNLLIGFTVCLLVIFIVEIAIGITAAVYKNDFTDILKSALKKSMQQYSKSEIEQTAWDKVQSELKCCGLEGPNDWQGQQLPFTCCHIYEELKNPLETYCLNAARGKYLYQDGCYERLKDLIHENTNVLIGVGIGIAFIEIAEIILGCWLAHAIKKSNGVK